MKAAEIRARAAIQPTIPDPRQFQQPAQQQQFQKPAWVQVVENEYPDVVTHDRGFDTVASFMRISGVQPHAVNADALRKAFGRAREELAPNNARSSRSPTSGRSWPAAARPRAPRRCRRGKSGTTVSLKGFPQGFDYRGAARRAGMSPEDYVRAYAKMNPGDVEKRSCATCGDTGRVLMDHGRYSARCPDCRPKGKPCNECHGTGINSGVCTGCLGAKIKSS
jgi:DnaJ-class molecular chaperone